MTSAASRLSRVLAGAGAAAALALLAPAAFAESAQAADYFLKIKGIEGDSGKAAAAGDKPRIAVLELQSWSFGATQTSSGHSGGGMGAGKVSMHDLPAAAGPQAGKVSKVEAIAIKQGAAAAAADGSASAGDRLQTAGPKDGWPAASAGEAEITLKGDAAEEARKRPGRVKYGDITLKQGAAAAAAGGVSVAAGDVDGDGRADLAAPRDSASGQATGKRQHKPMMLAAPLAAGSVTLFGRFTGCAVGARYPELELGGRSGPTYRIADAVVTSCAGGSASAGGGGLPMESVSFNYSKIEY